MEIDTALSDLEAADFAELVTFYFCLLCTVSPCLGVTLSAVNKHYLQNPSTSFNQVGVKAVYPEFLSMLDIIMYYDPIGLVTENP